MGRIHADWYEAYLKYQDNSEPPTLFKKWAAMSTIAGVLQRKCFMVWEDLIYPNMYVVICGPSGNRKSTAIRPVRQLLQALEVPIGSDSVTREGLIKTMTSNEKVIDPPIDFLEPTHSSITIISSELAVFLGVNNPQFLSALTDWYDCQSPWIYSTRGRGDELVRGIWVNLIGCITPMMVRQSLPRNAIGGGLTSRIIFVYGEGRSKLVSRPTYGEDTLAEFDELLTDLIDMGELQGEFKFTQEYENRYADWYEESYHNPPSHLSADFAAYLERRPMHVRKLSMIFNASRDGDMLLDVEDFDRALALIEETEVDMPKVFSVYGDLEEAELFQRILTYVKVHTPLTMGALMGQFYKDISSERMYEFLSTVGRTDPPIISMKMSTDGTGQSVIKYLGEKDEESKV